MYFFCFHHKQNSILYLNTFEKNRMYFVFIQLNSSLLYSLFYDSIVAQQLYRKLSFYNIFIFWRNLIHFYLCLNLVILYIVWWLASSEVLRGVGIISSQVFGHLRSFKGLIQTEACVIPSYHGMLIRYNCSTRLWDALYECLAKEVCL